MLRDVSNPPIAPARVCQPAVCPECCRYEMKLQLMREAFELLQQAVAANDQNHLRIK